MNEILYLLIYIQCVCKIYASRFLRLQSISSIYIGRIAIRSLDSDNLFRQIQIDLCKLRIRIPSWPWPEILSSCYKSVVFAFHLNQDILITYQYK